MIDVSIVIVCMNNLNNLMPCLESIVKSTHNVKYETFVVAYLFSDENLRILKNKFPEVIIIESNEIRGFSENNNLALRQANGEYCFVLNDDTLMKMPVVDGLLESIKNTPDAAIMSPKTVFGDGRLQSCGRPPMNFKTFAFETFKLWKEQKVVSPYVNQQGIFQTYNIVGAAFLIKTNVFKKLGFFDESYFFCPEDIALSTLANKRGYKCFVDETISLYHLEGGSSSGAVAKIKLAIRPAITKGNIIFYSEGSFVKKQILHLILTVESLLKIIYWFIQMLLGRKGSRVMLLSYVNVIRSIFSNRTPKEIFIKYYNK
jgi:GT2 family glycosyltransferase